MKNQDIFNHIVKHLHKQKWKQALDGNGVDCVFRGEEGRSCAVGCLITDDEYHEDIEGYDVGGILGKYSFKNFGHKNTVLLQKLQDFHDHSLIEGLVDDQSITKNTLIRIHLEKIAKEHKLKTGVLDEVFNT